MTEGTDPDLAWRPDPKTIARANLTAAIRDHGFDDYETLHRWSVTDRPAFWSYVADRLDIVFAVRREAVFAGDAEHASWFPGSRLNIAESCFTAPADSIAVVHRNARGLWRTSYAELRREAGRFASGLVAAGMVAGDRIAIAMPMTIEAVIAYLGVVLAGGVVVSIADSFAPHEIHTRLSLTDPTLVVTQDQMVRSGKVLPMYAKVVEAGAEHCVVVDTGAGLDLRSGDRWWSDALQGDGGFEAVSRDVDAHTNVLFSSGTTGAPKAIPWSQLTPLKAAMDGHFHQDIHPDDVVAWPTNLGWMMGPWLIYAALINGAALALYDDAPTGRGFAEFVRDAGVTVLGVVPSLVAVWRSTGVLEDVDWSAVRLVSSTGEASNPDDYRWLISRAGVVIEYCGGTEIGGGYLTGTVLEPSVPSTFTTPTLGLDVRILDEQGTPTTSGELFIVPPSVGLSTTLLNQDHHHVYFAGTPNADAPLRRHGDHMERLPGGRFRALGRVDDTMNLGGIKVASAEIERVVGSVRGVAEAAAVAVAPAGGGPGRLVVFVVAAPDAPADLELREAMQRAVRTELNPLFRIAEVVAVDELPRTASGKVMRRELRARYR